MTIVDKPADAEVEKYRGFRIKEVYAILCIDTEHDCESIPAFIMGDGTPLPLIAADEVRLEALKEMAQIVSNQMKRNFKVVRFSVREEIGEIKSRTTS